MGSIHPENLGTNTAIRLPSNCAVSIFAALTFQTKSILGSSQLSQFYAYFAAHTSLLKVCSIIKLHFDMP